MRKLYLESLSVRTPLLGENASDRPTHFAKALKAVLLRRTALLKQSTYLDGGERLQLRGVSFPCRQG